MSALVNTTFYGKPPSKAKFVCLLFIVGGVAFASLKKGEDGSYALKFDQQALIFGMIGNTFAAFKGSENKKLMEKKGIKDRIGGVANQFAMTEVFAFLISLPVMFYTEGAKWDHFVELVKTSRDLQIGARPAPDPTRANTRVRDAPPRIAPAQASPSQGLASTCTTSSRR